MNIAAENSQTEIYQALACVRLCGTRQAGGLYVECGLKPGGCLPIENFLVDPPQLIDPHRGFPVPTQGMGLIQDSQGTWHLVDRVGLVHYPYVTDILEEARFFGFSRRMPKSLKATVQENGKAVVKPALTLLTEKSRLLLVHDKAWIVNWQQYRPRNENEGWPPENAPVGWECPKPVAEHDPMHRGTACPTMCAGIWWRDLPPVDGKTIFPYNTTIPSRWVRRKLPSLDYIAATRPLDVKPIYAGPAIFASLPITRLVVVDDQKLEKLGGIGVIDCALPIQLVTK